MEQAIDAAARLENVRSQLAAEAEAAGRASGSVQLVAISKTKPAALIQTAYDAGQRHFGENRPQEMADKQPQLPADIHWHLVGQLQRSNVKHIAGFVSLIHSLDSVKLANEIEKRAARIPRQVDCLIQVNISGEDQKAGTDAEGARAILETAAGMEHLAVRGLMGIAELTEDDARIRAQFAGLRRLRDELAAAFSLELPHLSMGMTGDYPLAVAEGATLVRIGSAIFGGRS